MIGIGICVRQRKLHIIALRLFSIYGNHDIAASAGGREGKGIFARVELRKIFLFDCKNFRTDIELKIRISLQFSRTLFEAHESTIIHFNVNSISFGESIKNCADGVPIIEGSVLTSDEDALLPLFPDEFEGELSPQAANTAKPAAASVKDNALLKNFIISSLWILIY